MVFILNNETLCYVKLEVDTYKAAQLRFLLREYHPELQVITEAHVDSEEFDIVLSSYDNQYVPMGEVEE